MKRRGESPSPGPRAAETSGVVSSAPSILECPITSCMGREVSEPGVHESERGSRDSGGQGLLSPSNACPCDARHGSSVQYRHDAVTDELGVVGSGCREDNHYRHRVTGGRPCVRPSVPVPGGRPPHQMLDGISSNRFDPLTCEEIVPLSKDERGSEGEQSTSESPSGLGDADACESNCGRLLDGGFSAAGASAPTYRRRRRRKLQGDVAAHARFLQYYFRRTRMLRPGCWRRGGLRGLTVYRPPTVFACRNGLELAAPSEFNNARAEARRALDWYQNYVHLLRRLRSGQTPVANVGFCGQGGVSEGIRRAKGASHGQDIREQPRFEARFGKGTFSLGDSADAASARDLVKRTRAFVNFHSPPCKATSSSRFRGEASEPNLLKQTRDSLRSTGRLYAMENVPGARKSMGDQVTLLRGSLFGLHVDRPRLFETNFKVHVDDSLRARGDALRRRTCLGDRRRWRRLDPFGRPELSECCCGNLWAVQGDKPFRCTLAECAAAMEIDEHHMDYAGLSQAIPPVYSEYIFAQACMRQVEAEFGLEPITYDDYRARPSRSRRVMAHMLRGAGGIDPSQGLDFTQAGSDGLPPSDQMKPAPRADASPLLPPCPEYRPKVKGGSEDKVEKATIETVREAEWRELWYSWAGDYDLVSDRAAAWEALSPIRSIRKVAFPLSRKGLQGKNTLLLLGSLEFDSHLDWISELVVSEPGTRVTIEARGAVQEAALHQSGFKLVRRVRAGPAAYATANSSATMPRPCSYWAKGEVALEKADPVDYRRAELGMDPQDRPGGPSEPKTARVARSYMPIPWERERWDVGLPAEIDEIMARRGLGIYPTEEPGFSEVPFYKWANNEGLLKSIAEADRALLAGAMELVPASQIEDVRRYSTIHPWTIVDQGGGKWRLCHDYSVGTNRVVPTASFSLPEVWDVAPVVKESSHFAKYDIRDGFWHMPIASDSRKRLVVRHPGTGRLIWASRLPFGYVEAPRVFCALTEAVIGRVRSRCAGKGIHFFVFVDDVLVVGDNEELTREGMAALEEEFAARGVQWAPHKKRGPCQCIEFLGLLLCNIEGLRGITITEKRLGKLESEMAKWAELEHVSEAEAEPRELASFLGKLVFASQVVRNGRTYMQAMLSQFQGLIVDWRRGSVSSTSGSTIPLKLKPGFFRDLRWWRSHLRGRSLTPFEAMGARAGAVITGTDASGWGTGQVLWIDGAREESSLQFTAAEKRRPINWRELLGILRVGEVSGERLRGLTVLVESDNMAAVQSVRRGSSKAEDMQELLRRLVALCEKHGIILRVTHTPGEKLDRPDQTSRADAVEEPRARLEAGLFAKVSSRFGPFSDFVGAERHLEQGVANQSISRHFWLHPTVNTVGSALRLVQENLPGNWGSRAVVVVPDDGSPKWSTLLKHGLIIGRLSAGASGLEMNDLGTWRPRTLSRPVRVVLFPRSSGALVRRARMSILEGYKREELPRPDGGTLTRTRGEGYVDTSTGQELKLPLLPGSFVYSRPVEGEVGWLYRVCDARNPRQAKEEPDGVFAQVVWKASSQTARKLSPKPVFELNEGSEDHLPNPWELWTVDHLVESLGSSAAGRVSRFTFDYKRANAEIAARQQEWSEEDHSWVVLGDDDPALISPTQTAPRPPASVGSGYASGYSPFQPSIDPPETSDGLEGAVAQLERLTMAQHSSKSGTEGVLGSLERAAPLTETEGMRQPVVSPNQYAAMSCSGCKQPIALGEKCLSHGYGLVHDNEECKALLDKAIVEEREIERQASLTATVYYGVYSDEVGTCGVYTDWGEVARLVEGEFAADANARCERFDSFVEASNFVRECTRERASGVVAARRIKGSLLTRTQLAEKLAPARVDMITRCIEGKCGHIKGDGSDTMCRGGCGRSLHVATCGQLGKGFAALGNFTCVECRLAVQMDDVSLATPKMVETNQKTMILELSQGKESTAATYADYTQLEEKYVLGMGAVLDGSFRLPRHSSESFKNFLTWMSLDAERARSLESIVRTAGAMMTKLKIPDVTKAGDVRAHLKELIGDCGIEHEPATTATPRMLSMAVESGGCIDERYSDHFIAAREKVQFICEGVGGCRIGEVAGGGDVHGLLANEVAILEDLTADRGKVGSVVVEAKLEHSKTGFSRYLTMASVTANSGIKCAEITRDYWRRAGFSVVTSEQAGVRVSRPDFWVVRVSFAGMDHHQLEQLLAFVAKDMRPEIGKCRKGTLQDAKRRFMAGSPEKRYVNIAGGTGDSEVLRDILADLQMKGMTASIVPGPYLLATTGGRYPLLKLMPYSTSSAFKPTKEILEMAYARANRDQGDLDPDLDLDARDEAKWSTHSLRRLADTVARRYREASETSDAEIDIYFGWNERVLKKAMQVHYASMSIRERMSQAKVTGMM